MYFRKKNKKNKKILCQQKKCCTFAVRFESKGDHLFYWETDRIYQQVGAGLVATGAAMFVTGIILKTAGKNSAIKKSVNMYNGGLNNKTGMDVKFGITGKGVRLAINF